MITRRDFFTWCGSVVAISGSFPRYMLAQTSAITPIVPGPEVDQFKIAQQKLLLRYGVSVRSRYVKLDKPALTAHVLEAGRGEPVLLLHGGIATACHFAPLIGSLQQQFHVFAADRPGCGLTDKINYRGVPLREHAVDFVAGVLDGLQLRKAAIVANSLGGYWALLFALAHPERVTKLVLIGEPAGSSPKLPTRPPEPAPTSLENMRAIYQLRVANGDRLPSELLEEGLASARLPGVSLAWATWLEQSKGQFRTYNLRPELKGLRPATLFAWGDKDYNGPPTLGQEMAAMAQHARGEVVPDAGHWAWIDQPDLCARLTVEFLKSAGGSSPAL